MINEWINKTFVKAFRSDTICENKRASICTVVILPKDICSIDHRETYYSDTIFVMT